MEIESLVTPGTIFIWIEPWKKSYLKSNVGKCHTWDSSSIVCYYTFTECTYSLPLSKKIVKNRSDRWEKAHLVRHKSTCYWTQFISTTLGCVIYTTFLNKSTTVTAEVQESHPSVGSSWCCNTVIQNNKEVRKTWKINRLFCRSLDSVMIQSIYRQPFIHKAALKGVSTPPLPYWLLCHWNC